MSLQFKEGLSNGSIFMAKIKTVNQASRRKTDITISHGLITYMRSIVEQ